MLALGAMAVTAAQTPHAFDAASVKMAAATGMGQPRIVAVTGRRVSAPFVTLRMLVQVAFNVDRDQVIGGPAWLDSDHFEVNATSPTGTSIADVRTMLQALLAERFGLVAHRETRELPAHVLTFSGQFGPKMRRSPDECAPVALPPGLPVPPPPPPPPVDAAEFIALGVAPGIGICQSLTMGGFISGRAMGIATLCWFLTQELRRPVLDRTGLTERYDFDLMYLPDVGPPQMNGTPAPWDAPSLTTAVREQLGLRLDSTRAPIDVVVIDRVTAPTQN